MMMTATNTEDVKGRDDDDKNKGEDNNDKDNDDEDGADAELVPEALGGAVDINWSPPITDWSRH